MAKILGINLSHYASAAVVVDGEIVAAVGEERMNRIKNWAGFPEKAIHEVLRISGLSGSEIELVAIGTRCEIFIPNLAQVREYRPLTRIISFLSRFIPTTILGSHFMKAVYVQLVSRLRARSYRREYEHFFNALGISWTKVRIYDHHQCHAATAHFLKPWSGESLIFTNDGLGDGLCATVSRGDKNRIEREVEITAIHSLGGVYSRVTRFLGLKPWNDEYKVMGLAPYANPEQAKPVVDFFGRFFRVEGREFHFQINHLGDQFIAFLNKKIANVRFDHVALGVQTLLENTACTWIRDNIRQTGIGRITLAGGVGLNVKVNKLIGELPEVVDMFVFPAAGDDSISIGAALLGDQELAMQEGTTFAPRSLAHLYLGTDVADDLDPVIQSLDPAQLQVRQPDDLSGEVAQLLLDGKIVARCCGRMEYGPRALGNRSILADPTRIENVGVINRAIKNRDFWMPFAPMMLDTWADRYLVNPKGLRAPFMVHAFDTNPTYRHHIRAAVHQADFTVRPQVVTETVNPALYELLRRFEALSGRGALLNTSFNLHGFPIVRSAHDAVDVLMRSGLRYLILGNYLIEKRS